MYNSLRGVGVTQIADAMLFAEQVFDFHAGLRVIQTDGIVFTSSDQQILRPVEVDGVHSPLVVLSQPHNCSESHCPVERAYVQVCTHVGTLNTLPMPNVLNTSSVSCMGHS